MFASSLLVVAAQAADGRKLQRVICCTCGGSIDLDLPPVRLRSLVERMGARHRCAVLA